MLTELTELCNELNNWFDRSRYFGTFTIKDGQINVSDLVSDGSLQDGQYFRIIGSVFNDGVYKYPAVNLEDEEFEGAVWAMAVPPSVVALAKEIEDWQNKYGGVDSQAMSPFQSESFGGYSYTKKSGSNSNSGADTKLGTWQGAFATKLNRYRRLRP